MKCSICSSDTTPVVSGLYDDRYGYPEAFSLIACRKCGHLMTSPVLSEAEIPDLYGNYYPRKNTDILSLADQVNEPASFRERWSRRLKGTDNQGQYRVTPGMKVLDYGCGAAVSLLEIQKLGGEAYGIEADPNVKAIADHYHLNVHIGRIEDNPFPGVRFDLIILNQVVEHLPDPGKLLRALAERLAEGGRMVLSFPNAGSVYCKLFGKRWINWHIPYHLQHFNRRSFMRLAESNGLRILGYRTITPNLWTVLQFRTLSYPATRGVPNPMWGGSAPEAASEGGFQAPPSFARRLKNYALGWLGRLARPLNGILICLGNRTIDCLGWGDSAIVVLAPKSGRG